MRVFKHLTFTDRIRIEKWKKEGMRTREIAEKLRVDPSTVYRELKRGQLRQAERHDMGTDPDIQPRHRRAEIPSTPAGKGSKPENRQRP